jgi:hypothetical protein
MPNQNARIAVADTAADNGTSDLIAADAAADAAARITSLILAEYARMVAWEKYAIARDAAADAEMVAFDGDGDFCAAEVARDAAAERQKAYFVARSADFAHDAAADAAAE